MMQQQRNNTTGTHCSATVTSRGTVLVVTLLVIIALTSLILVFAQQMQVESQSTANATSQKQAEHIAHGALQYAMGVLHNNRGKRTTAEELPSEGVILGEGHYWLLTKDIDRSDGGMAFGITDECSRVNLNSVTQDMLIRIPNMTEEFAASIIDWRDSNTEELPGGAESDYYLSLDDPYYAKDQPFETMEELMKVRGYAPFLVYGEDTNRNAILDPNENDRDASLPDDNGDGTLDWGLIDYTTPYTFESSGGPDGEGLINVNDSRPEGLDELLDEHISASDIDVVRVRIRAGRPYANMLDFYYRGGLEPDQFNAVAPYLAVMPSSSQGSGGGGGRGGSGGLPGLDELADELAGGAGSGGGTGNTVIGPGLVNINTAPQKVLELLPGLDEGDASMLVATRNTTDPDPGQIGWVAEALTPEKARIFGNYITSRSYQYSIDVLAVSQFGRSFKRLRAVVDVSGQLPRILYIEDLTMLGWPLDPQLLEDIRSGTFTGVEPRFTNMKE